MASRIRHSFMCNWLGELKFVSFVRLCKFRVSAHSSVNLLQLRNLCITKPIFYSYSTCGIYTLFPHHILNSNTSNWHELLIFRKWHTLSLDLRRVINLFNANHYLWNTTILFEFIGLLWTLVCVCIASNLCDRIGWVIEIS